MLLDPSLPREFVLMWFIGSRFLGKSDFLFGKFCLCLLGGELRLLDLFVACFVGRWRKRLISSFLDCQYARGVWRFFNESLLLAMLAIRAFVR